MLTAATWTLDEITRQNSRMIPSAAPAYGAMMMRVVEPEYEAEIGRVG
jgi:hypothetical protein